MKKQIKGKVTMVDYIKAMKKVHREVELENSTGFKSTTKVHKSKKAYNRRESKRIDFDTFPFLFFAQKHIVKSKMSLQYEGSVLLM